MPYIPLYKCTYSICHYTLLPTKSKINCPFAHFSCCNNVTYITYSKAQRRASSRKWTEVFADVPLLSFAAAGHRVRERRPGLSVHEGGDGRPRSSLPCLLPPVRPLSAPTVGPTLPVSCPLARSDAPHLREISSSITFLGLQT